MKDKVKAKLDAIRERAGKMPPWQIAEETGVSEAMVKWYATTNGISLALYRTAWTDPEIAHVSAMKQEGKSHAEIGKWYGVSASAIEILLYRTRKPRKAS